MDSLNAQGFCAFYILNKVIHKEDLIISNAEGISQMAVDQRGRAFVQPSSAEIRIWSTVSPSIIPRIAQQNLLWHLPRHWKGCP